MKGKFKVIRKSCALFVVLSLLFVGCASTTVIKSSPDHANIYIGDIKKGTTPYELTDTKVLYSSERVKLEKKGYKTLRTEIKKDATLNVGALVGGCFVGVPLLWLFGYEKEYFFEMEPN
jgi:hypothetical protein